jgi:serine protease Do
MKRSRTPKQAECRQQLLMRVIIRGLILALVLSVNSALAAENFPSYADLANEVKHPVVNIFTTKVFDMGQRGPFDSPGSPFEEFFKHFFGGLPEMKRKSTALGSGFIIDRSGLIVTNNHVVEKADEIKVRLENLKEYEAEIVGRDPKTDLALIRVKPDSDFPDPVEFGNSDKIPVGEGVMAVGNPFGLGHTVTVGIISAKGRVIGAGPYDDFLQTDAAINPGNSGGPLFDMNGKVVGINTAIIAGGQGIGFAIPINLAVELLPQLKTGKVIRGWIGVAIQDVTPELARAFNLEKTDGVLVASVTADSPAEKSGLQRGDVIVQFDGKKLENAQELSRMVASKDPGTKVPIVIARDGEKKELSLHIGTMEDESGLMPAEKGETSEEKWGLSLQPLTPQLAQRLGYDKNEKGLVVSRVDPVSPAAEVGIQRGDVIKEINRKEVQSLEDMRSIIEDSGKEDELLLLVKRGKSTFYAVLDG